MPAEAPYAGGNQLQLRSVPDPEVPLLAEEPRDSGQTVGQTGAGVQSEDFWNR